MRWTIHDEAIHRGENYAGHMQPLYADMQQEGELVSVASMLKQAYQEGFLHGFEHKFDQTNYEEK